MFYTNSWGKLSRDRNLPIISASPKEVYSKLPNASNTFLTRGQGKSYGDVCQSPERHIVLTDQWNRIISLDIDNGIVECESGILISDLQNVVSQYGWILQVTPGTELISIGGAIANDIHGKNHHLYGSFGNTINYLLLLRSNGELLKCYPQGMNSELFSATVGGIGLTGIIISASIHLKKLHSPLLKVKQTNFHGLDEFLNYSEIAESESEYSVAWIDCLSSTNLRGIFQCADHIRDGDLKIEKNSIINKQSVHIPFEPSFSLINQYSLKIFNEIYYQIQCRKPFEYKQDYRKFLYPLDEIDNWNVIYGKKGFFQYQCVIPKSSSRDCIQQLLKIISKYNQGSFLAVLKSFGKIPSLGMLSFPIEGVTLALDFPNKGEKTLALFNEMDEVVRSSQGKIYLAKDARMPKELFESTYPNLSQFIKYRDPLVSSKMSQRLMGF